MLSNAAAKDPAMSGQLNYEIPEGQFYPTPIEHTDCLLHFIDLREFTKVWEPACGEGDISKHIDGFCKSVISTDLYDRGYGYTGIDFLETKCVPEFVDAIITNPPYGDEAIKFVEHALYLTEPVKGVVAMFMRNEWDCAVGRDHIFEQHPAWHMKIVCQKRPRFIKGSTGAPRHNYAWFVWDWSRVHENEAATIRYIHPKNARPIGLGKAA